MKRFGQSALATPANFVTVTRMLVAIPTLILIRDRGASWLTWALWFAITATDSLDGWLARRDGATRSGAFLDPVADKLIVLGGLAVLADTRRVPVVARASSSRVREFGISLYRTRSRAGAESCCPRRGSASTRRSCSTARSGSCCWPLTEDATTFQHVTLYAAVALTVISGLADRAAGLGRLAAPGDVSAST